MKRHPLTAAGSALLGAALLLGCRAPSAATHRPTTSARPGCVLPERLHLAEAARLWPRGGAIEVTVRPLPIVEYTTPTCADRAVAGRADQMPTRRPSDTAYTSPRP